jgi:Predicted methyltransferases
MHATILLISHIEPNITVAIARELTKIHEEYIRGNIKDVIEELKKRNNIKGEIVLVLSKENTVNKESN